jgi:hypothetical protein
MRWSTSRRTIAALFAAWSFVVEEEPAALHTCAMHDGAAHVSSTTAAKSSHVGGLGERLHHSDAVANAERSHDGDSSDHSRCCTCLGPCCDASPVVSVDSPQLLVAPTITAAALPAVRRTTHIPSAPEHSRPPSIGPPAPSIG